MFVVRLRLWWLMVSLALGQVPLFAETVAGSSVPSPFTTLAWNPSPSINAAGYFICWGFASGDYPNRIDVGNVTNATIGGLNTELTYHFSVIVYDSTGREGPPSNEVQYSVPPEPPVPPAPPLTLKPSNSANGNSALCLSFQANLGEIYDIQATRDFQQWETLWSTNCAADGPIVFEVIDQATDLFRFYRLLRH